MLVLKLKLLLAGVNDLAFTKFSMGLIVFAFKKIIFPLPAEEAYDLLYKDYDDLWTIF